jgi:hypothetical protein
MTMYDGQDIKAAVHQMAQDGVYESDEALAFEAHRLGMDFESVHAVVERIAPYAPEAFVAGLITGLKLRETR